MRPWKKSQAEINDRGIERIGRAVEVDAECIIRIEATSRGNQRGRKGCIESPIAPLISISQCAALHRSAYAHVVELGLLRVQADDRIAQAVNCANAMQRN